MPIYPETQVQIAALEWLQFQYPEVRRYVIKIDNEGMRSNAGNFVAIQAGLHPGASDLFIAWPTNNYPGMWLEIKREKWKLTKKDKFHYESQMEFIRKMKIKGYFAEFAIGLDECISAIKTYLS